MMTHHCSRQQELLQSGTEENFEGISGSVFFCDDGGFQMDISGSESSRFLNKYGERVAWPDAGVADRSKRGRTGSKRSDHPFSFVHWRVVEICELLTRPVVVVVAVSSCQKETLLVWCNLCSVQSATQLLLNLTTTLELFTRRGVHGHGQQSQSQRTEEHFEGTHRGHLSHHSSERRFIVLTDSLLGLSYLCCLSLGRWAGVSTLLLVNRFHHISRKSSTCTYERIYWRGFLDCN